MAKKSNGKRTNLEKSFDEMGDLGGNNYFKPKEGKNTIRVLPAWNDEGVFFFKASLHYGLREEGGPVPCMSMVDKPCLACEKLKLQSKEIKRKAGQRTRFYMNVIDRKNPEAGVLIWGVTPKNMKKIKSIMEDPDYGDITDPDDGRDLTVEVDTSKGGPPSYEIRPRGKTTPVDYDDWEEELHSLDEEVIPGMLSNKEMKALCDEAFGEDDEDDDEEEDRKSKKSKKEDKKKKKSKKDDDDDDEVSDDDDDEDGDKKKKSKKEDKKSKGKKKSSKKDDDDEDEDDD